MNVTIQEAPPMIEQKGFSFFNVIVYSLIAALLSGIGGFQLGQQDKDREVKALKERYGIDENTPSLSPTPPSTR